MRERETFLTCQIFLFFVLSAVSVMVFMNWSDYLFYFKQIIYFNQSKSSYQTVAVVCVGMKCAWKCFLLSHSGLESMLLVLWCVCVGIGRELCLVWLGCLVGWAGVFFPDTMYRVLLTFLWVLCCRWFSSWTLCSSERSCFVLTRWVNVFVNEGRVCVSVVEITKCVLNLCSCLALRSPDRVYTV